MRDHRVGAGLPCPLWVKSGHSGNSKQCPLYPRKRTSELNRAMSALYQKRTLPSGRNPDAVTEP